MEELMILFYVIVVVGTLVFIGWSVNALYDIYYKYRVKRNHTKYPKLIELQKEREKVCEEYNRWWDEKHEAQKRIDKNFEIMKYCTEVGKKKHLVFIEQDQQIYTDADAHMKELRPLVDAAREAEQIYREKYNIRHW